MIKQRCTDMYVKEEDKTLAALVAMMLTQLKAINCSEPSHACGRYHISQAIAQARHAGLPSMQSGMQTLQDTADDTDVVHIPVLSQLTLR